MEDEQYIWHGRKISVFIGASVSVCLCVCCLECVCVRSHFVRYQKSNIPSSWAMCVCVCVCRRKEDRRRKKVIVWCGVDSHLLFCVLSAAWCSCVCSAGRPSYGSGSWGHCGVNEFNLKQNYAHFRLTDRLLWFNFSCVSPMVPPT